MSYIKFNKVVGDDSNLVYCIDYELSITDTSTLPDYTLYGFQVSDKNSEYELVKLPYSREYPSISSNTSTLLKGKEYVNFSYSNNYVAKGYFAVILKYNSNEITSSYTVDSYDYPSVNARLGGYYRPNTSSLSVKLCPEITETSYFYNVNFNNSTTVASIPDPIVLNVNEVCVAKIANSIFQECYVFDRIETEWVENSSIANTYTAKVYYKYFKQKQKFSDLVDVTYETYNSATVPNPTEANYQLITVANVTVNATNGSLIWKGYIEQFDFDQTDSNSNTEDTNYIFSSTYKSISGLSSIFDIKNLRYNDTKYTVSEKSHLLKPNIISLIDTVNNTDDITLIAPNLLEDNIIIVNFSNTFWQFLDTFSTEKPQAYDLPENIPDKINNDEVYDDWEIYVQGSKYQGFTSSSSLQPNTSDTIPVVQDASWQNVSSNLYQLYKTNKPKNIFPLYIVNSENYRFFRLNITAKQVKDNYFFTLLSDILQASCVKKYNDSYNPSTIQTINSKIVVKTKGDLYSEFSSDTNLSSIIKATVGLPDKTTVDIQHTDQITVSGNFIDTTSPGIYDKQYTSTYINNEAPPVKKIIVVNPTSSQVLNTVGSSSISIVTPVMQYDLNQTPDSVLLTTNIAETIAVTDETNTSIVNKVTKEFHCCTTDSPNITIVTYKAPLSNSNQGIVINQALCSPSVTSEEFALELNGIRNIALPKGTTWTDTQCLGVKGNTNISATGIVTQGTVDTSKIGKYVLNYFININVQDKYTVGTSNINSIVTISSTNVNNVQGDAEIRILDDYYNVINKSNYFYRNVAVLSLNNFNSILYDNGTILENNDANISFLPIYQSTTNLDLKIASNEINKYNIDQITTKIEPNTILFNDSITQTVTSVTSGAKVNWFKHTGTNGFTRKGYISQIVSDQLIALTEGIYYYYALYNDGIDTEPTLHRIAVVEVTGNQNNTTIYLQTKPERAHFSWEMPVIECGTLSSNIYDDNNSTYSISIVNLSDGNPIVLDSTTNKLYADIRKIKQQKNDIIVTLTNTTANISFSQRITLNIDVKQYLYDTRLVIIQEPGVSDLSDIVLTGNTVVFYDASSQNELTSAVVTATDIDGTDISSNIKTISFVNTTNSGVYREYFYVTLSNSTNISTYRTVCVYNADIPVLYFDGLYKAADIIKQNDTYTAPVAKVVNSTTTINTNDYIDTSTPGQYLLSYKYTNSQGKSAKPIYKTIYVLPTNVDSQLAVFSDKNGCDNCQYKVEIVGTKNYSDIQYKSKETQVTFYKKPYIVLNDEQVIYVDKAAADNTNILNNYFNTSLVSAYDSDNTPLQVTKNVVNKTTSTDTLEDGDELYTVIYTASNSKNIAADPVTQYIIVSSAITHTLTFDNAAYDNIHLSNAGEVNATYLLNIMHVTLTPEIENTNININIKFKAVGSSTQTDIISTALSNITNENVATYIDSSALGTYTITYSIADNDDINDLIQYIYIEDLQAPVITLTGPQTIELDYNSDIPENLLGATAVDNVDNTVTVTQVIKRDGETLSDITTKYSGNYIVTYTAEDSCGNKAEVVQTITVKQNKAEFIDAVVTDTTNTQVQYQAIIERTFNYASDSIAVISVQDVYPEITIKGDNPVILNPTDTWTDPGVDIIWLSKLDNTETSYIPEYSLTTKSTLIKNDNNIYDIGLYSVLYSLTYIDTENSTQKVITAEREIIVKQILTLLTGESTNPITALQNSTLVLGNRAVVSFADNTISHDLRSSIIIGSNSKLKCNTVTNIVINDIYLGINSDLDGIIRFDSTYTNNVSCDETATISTGKSSTFPIPHEPYYRNLVVEA